VGSRRGTKPCRRDEWPEKRLKVTLLSGWSAWTGPISGSSLRLTVILSTLAMGPAVAPAQRASGSLGVSAMVLPPVMMQPAGLTSFRVESDGTARLETTAPIAGAASLIVMSTVSSSANGFVPVALPPARVRAMPRKEWLEGATRPTAAPAARWHYDVDLGTPPVRSGSQDVSVRISYLIVPGT
jgi:hypothetical protein